MSQSPELRILGDPRDHTKAEKPCAKCGQRPRRAKTQRWCKECHTEYVRTHRLERSLDMETDPTDCGPLSGVYFLECAGFIKIGFASNVYRRAAQIRSHNPLLVTPLGFQQERRADAVVMLEQALHAQFKEHRHRAEWFRDCEQIRAYVAAHARSWPEGEWDI